MRMFVSIADKKSFKGAAEEMELSPSVISKHLSALEKHLGVSLIERTTRNVKLTEIGQSYLVKCRHILDEVDSFEANLKKRTGQLKGVLKVNAPPGFGHRHIAPHLPLFLAENEGMIVDITTANNDSNSVLFDVDLHIKISEANIPSGCEMAVLAPNWRKLVASPSYIEKMGTPHTVSDLDKHQLVTLDPAHHNNDWHFRINEDHIETYRAHGSVRIDSGDGLLRTVLNDGGFAMLPTYIVGRHIQSGALVSVLEAQVDESNPVHAIWRRSNHRWPRISAFISYLRSIYGELPYWDDENAARSAAALRASK